MPQGEGQLLEKIGYIKAKVEDIEVQTARFHSALQKHLDEEMVELDALRMEIQKLNNWKIKVSAVGGVVGFIVSQVWTFIISR